MVTVTDKAAVKLKEIMETEERTDQALRIMVKSGGCSGFSYAMGFDGNKTDEDVVFEQHGITVMIDPNSLPFLHGIEVDYVDSLMGGGFAIRNPNANRTCGCGQSFRTAEQNGAPDVC